MKKKTLICVLGGLFVGALSYYLYTMNKVRNIEDDTLEPDDDELDNEFVYEDDDLDFDYDANQPSDKHKIVQFNNIEQDDVFQQNSPLQTEEDEVDVLEHPTESIISDTPINILDYDTSYFELVCNISRDDAIKLILKERTDYEEKDLRSLTNSEFADIYSEIINN